MAEEWTKEHMRSVFESVKNWGRWGADDEMGALNLITPKKRVEAAQCVVTGDVVSCARELAVHPNPENLSPALHMMIRAGDDCLVPGVNFETAMDFVGVAFHGMATSHIDALCHLFVDGQMYNGFSKDEVNTTGAPRGISMSVDWVDPGTGITVEQLEAAEESQGVSVAEGDILLVGTGRDARRAAVGPWSPHETGLAGLHAECVPWLHERGIAVLGCDGVSDQLPPLGIPDWFMPIHQCTLVAMGVHLLDNLRLDRLAEACAREARWAFQFTVAPLRIDMGTGSPVNPNAVL